MIYVRSEGYPIELRGYYIEMDIPIHVVVNEYGNLIQLD